MPGSRCACICGDRFRHAEFTEAMAAAGLGHVPFIWRGFGWKDGAEDTERFRRALFDGQYELRQVALHLDEGRALEGATAEVVQELRAQGGYRGTPVPFEALVARSLALRGEAVFLIRDGHLVPCVDWELSTRNGEPTAYRVGIPEVGGGTRATVLAPEVLHFRIGCDVGAPWAGTAPLARAKLSASLLAEIEAALRDVFRDAPIGSLIVPLPEGSADDMAALRASFRGRRGSSLIIEGTAQATAAGLNPQIGQKPDQPSPDLQRTLADTLLKDARSAIFGVYGILPALHSPNATGPAVREAQRHLAQLVLQPIADQIAEECSDKLGAAISIDVAHSMGVHDHGGRARAFSTIIGAMATAKEAGLDAAAIAQAADRAGLDT